MDAISPDWDNCIKKSGLFKNFFKLFLGFFSIGLIRPIIFNTIKYSFGIVFTSIGIAFNEALSTITVLKTISDYVLNFIPIMPALNNLISLFKGQVSLPTNLSVNNNDIKETFNETSSLLSFLGLIILGAGTILIVLFTGDYFISSAVRTIPGVGTILDSLYSAGNYILSWFYSAPKPDIDPSTPKSIELDFIPESISRSSSGGSTASDTTFTQPTAPATRPGTPSVWPNPRDPRDTGSNWE